jgi:alginate O-acetyltransferase complex protein AlgI
LFITYFPHLIAGPILHHKEMIPQFTRPSTYQWNAENIAAGLTVFFIGLFKKTVLADGIAPHAVTVFAVVAKGQDVTFLEAWLGCICYIFQLYFDFSGYCDMAIGGSLMFGIKLPLNFHSPYKAVNIFEFWRRWHMTLSRFLRDYIYTPLSHGRQKPWRLMMNLVITMIVGGVWHGAGWNYFLWGAMHGFFLIVNHLWRNLRRQVFGHDLRHSTRLGHVLACALTFAAFTFSSALFRSPDLESGVRMMKGMLALSGFAFPLEWRGQFGTVAPLLDAAGVSFQQLNTRVGDTGFTSDAFNWMFYLGVLIWMMPNTQQIMGRYFPALTPYQGDKQAIPAMMLWVPTPIWAVVVSVAAIIGLANITKVSEFLYYQF